MNHSILPNTENFISFFEQSYDSFLKNPDQLTEFIEALRTTLDQLGVFLLKSALEACDQALNDSKKRKQDWLVETHTVRTLLTSFGPVSFSHTRFRNRETGATSCLLDRLLGLSPHQRLTGDATVRLLDEAVQSSYRRAGEAASQPDPITRQAVMRHLHGLKFPPLPSRNGEKRVVETLYLDADEDHVALQYQKTKGDLVVNEQNQKNNGLLTKLVYVYEGIEPVPHAKGRYRLSHPYYFGGCYEGETANNQLWDDVYRYLSQTYDLERVKRIYLNGDGGAWIRAGEKRIAGITYVVDGFHLEKYKNKALAQSGEAKPEKKKELDRLLNANDRAGLRRWCEKRLEEATQGKGRIQEGYNYLLRNWTGIQERLHGEQVVGCSAEGHVSHILSARMSSRPMGWCRAGAEAMAKLRIYVKNGGDLRELVKEQTKKEEGKPEEAEVLSCKAMLNWEHKHANPLGPYWEKLQATVSMGTKKRVYFQTGIWGL